MVFHIQRQHCGSVHSESPDLNERTINALLPIHTAISAKAFHEHTKNGLSSRPPPSRASTSSSSIVPVRAKRSRYAYNNDSDEDESHSTDDEYDRRLSNRSFQDYPYAHRSTSRSASPSKDAGRWDREPTSPGRDRCSRGEGEGGLKLIINGSGANSTYRQDNPAHGRTADQGLLSLQYRHSRSLYPSYSPSDPSHFSTQPLSSPGLLGWAPPSAPQSNERSCYQDYSLPLNQDASLRSDEILEVPIPLTFSAAPGPSPPYQPAAPPLTTLISPLIRRNTDSLTRDPILRRYQRHAPPALHLSSVPYTTEGPISSRPSSTSGSPLDFSFPLLSTTQSSFHQHPSFTAQFLGLTGSHPMVPSQLSSSIGPEAEDEPLITTPVGSDDPSGGLAGKTRLHQDDPSFSPSFKENSQHVLQHHELYPSHYVSYSSNVIDISSDPDAALGSDARLREFGARGSDAPLVENDDRTASGHDRSRTTHARQQSHLVKIHATPTSSFPSLSRMFPTPQSVQTRTSDLIWGRREAVESHPVDEGPRYRSRIGEDEGDYQGSLWGFQKPSSTRGRVPSSSQEMVGSEDAHSSFKQRRLSFPSARNSYSSRHGLAKHQSPQSISHHSPSMSAVDIHQNLERGQHPSYSLSSRHLPAYHAIPLPQYHGNHHEGPTSASSYHPSSMSDDLGGYQHSDPNMRPIPSRPASDIHLNVNETNEPRVHHRPAALKLDSITNHSSGLLHSPSELRLSLLDSHDGPRRFSLAISDLLSPIECNTPRASPDNPHFVGPEETVTPPLSSPRPATDSSTHTRPDVRSRRNTHGSSAVRWDESSALGLEEGEMGEGYRLRPTAACAF